MTVCTVAAVPRRQALPAFPCRLPGADHRSARRGDHGRYPSRRRRRRCAARREARGDRRHSAPDPRADPARHGRSAIARCCWSASGSRAAGPRERGLRLNPVALQGRARRTRRHRGAPIRFRLPAITRPRKSRQSDALFVARHNRRLSAHAAPIRIGADSGSQNFPVGQPIGICLGEGRPTGRFFFALTPQHGSWSNLLSGFVSKMAGRFFAPSASHQGRPPSQKPRPSQGHRPRPSSITGSATLPQPPNGRRSLWTCGARSMSKRGCA